MFHLPQRSFSQRPGVTYPHARHVNIQSHARIRETLPAGGGGGGGWRGAAGGDTEGEPTRPTATLPTLSVRLHHRSHEMPPPPPPQPPTHPPSPHLPATHPPKCDTVSGTLGTQTGPCAATVPVCQNNSAVCKTVSLRFHSRLKQVAVGHWRGCVNPCKQVCGSLGSSETLLLPPLLPLKMSLHTPETTCGGGPSVCLFGLFHENFLPFSERLSAVSHFLSHGKSSSSNAKQKLKGTFKEEVVVVGDSGGGLKCHWYVSPRAHQA